MWYGSILVCREGYITRGWMLPDTFRPQKSPNFQPVNKFRTQVCLLPYIFIFMHGFPHKLIAFINRMPVGVLDRDTQICHVLDAHSQQILSSFFQQVHLAQTKPFFSQLFLRL